MGNSQIEYCLLRPEQIIIMISHHFVLRRQVTRGGWSESSPYLCAVWVGRSLVALRLCHPAAFLAVCSGLRRQGEISESSNDVNQMQSSRLPLLKTCEWIRKRGAWKSCHSLGPCNPLQPQVCFSLSSMVDLWGHLWANRISLILSQTINLSLEVDVMSWNC